MHRLRRGYFYTLDVALALIILIVGIIMIAAIYFYSPEKEKAEALSSDVSGLLASTKLTDVCQDIDSCTCSYATLTALCSSGMTRNNQVTLLELMGQLYHDNQRQAIEDLVNETLIQPRIVPGNFQLEIVLYDPLLPEHIEQLYPLVER